MKLLQQRLLNVMPYVFWAWLVLVTYLMLMELAPSTGGWPYWDKVQHIGVFFLLATLAFLAYAPNRRWIVVGLLSYGAVIEILQGWLTITRMASVGDWLADTTGVLLVVGAYFLWSSRPLQVNA